MQTLFPTSLEESLLKKFEEIHNCIYANDGLSASQALEEILKVLFLKVYNENLENSLFYLTEEEFTKAKTGTLHKDFTQRIKELWQAVLQTFADVFEVNEKIKLSPYSLSFTINKLQNIDFKNTKDAKGLAFQKFLARSEKTGRGQFFTPEPVIDFCVKFLAPKANEKIIDPTCGSGGFLFSAYQYIVQASRLETDKKTIIQNLFGIDINKSIVKIAKMKLLLECNTQLNIKAQNALNDLDELSLAFEQKLEGMFDIVLANPPFGTSGKINNSQTLQRFELGYKWKPSVQDSTLEPTENFMQTKTLHKGQVSEILFIERCLALLKEGGRMAIVLPNGHFENPSLAYLRYFIKSKANVLAVVNLPQETFIPFGTGVKTSILFLQKKTQPLVQASTLEAEAIFFAQVQKLGYQGTKNAKPLYQKDEQGLVLKDEQGKLLLEEDFSEILTDYQTFKKSENSQDFRHEKSFGFPLSALNGRFDYNFYAPKYRNLLNKLKENKAIPLGELCEIVKQKSTKLSDRQQFVNYVELSDINTQAFEIINTTEMPVHELPSRASYDLQENDMITAVAGNSIGTRKHATALVNAEFEGNICTNGFRILRNPQIDLYYLLYYLSTEFFLKQVFMYRTGAAIPNISDKDLAKILIHIPQKEDLEQISHKMQKTFELRRKAKEELLSVNLTI